MITESQCNICHGSGVCTLCHGQGGIWGGYGRYQNYMPCRSCGSMGRCKYCGGDGINTFTATYFPESGDMYGMDERGHIYETPGTGSYSSGSRSYLGRGNSGSSNASCPTCKGSGKCTTCKGNGIYYNTTYGGYVDCSVCKKTGICGTCHGAGVIRGTRK